MKDHLDFDIIGETKDDAIGECYDKVARVLGLPYPGGIPIDKYAKLGKHTYKLPSPSTHDNSYDFSYSGLKTNVINLVHKLEQNDEQVNRDDMCCSFQETAVDMVIQKAMRAVDEYQVQPVVLAGGVSANSYLREQITSKLANTGIDVIIPPMWCCTDNAAMIAKVASRLYDLGIFADLNLSVDPSWKIDHYKEF